MQSEGTVKKSLSHLIIAFIALFVFQQIASKTGHGIAQLFDFSKIDADDTFAYISVHHIIQILIAGIAIFVAHKVAQLDFGLRGKFSKAGIKYISIFAGVFLVYVLSSYFIGYHIGSIIPYDYPLTATNVCGTLGFQLFLSGHQRSFCSEHCRSPEICLFNFGIVASKTDILLALSMKMT